MRGKYELKDELHDLVTPSKLMITTDKTVYTCHAGLWHQLAKLPITVQTSVQAGAVLMPLTMFLLSLKSIRVVSIFYIKLAYLYIKSLRRKDLFTCIYCCYYVAYQDLKKEEN